MRLNLRGPGATAGFPVIDSLKPRPTVALFTVSRDETETKKTIRFDHDRCRFGSSFELN